MDNSPYGEVSPSTTISHQHVPSNVGKTNMSETKNIFETGSGNGWNAGIGGAIGAVLGTGGFGGFGGNNRNAASTEYVAEQVNGLRETIRSDATNEQISDIRTSLATVPGQVDHAIRHATDRLGCEISGIKESLCHLGYAIKAEGGETRQLIQTNALLAANARNAELSAQLALAHGDAKHATTQVLLQQVINQGKG